MTLMGWSQKQPDSNLGTRSSEMAGTTDPIPNLPRSLAPSTTDPWPLLLQIPGPFYYTCHQPPDPCILN